MKKTSNGALGLVVPNKVRIAGTTFYVRQGQLVGCPAKREKKDEKVFTMRQFIQRQKMRHTTALWKMLKECDVMFTERKNACQNFSSLANRLLPTVYVKETMNQASFLMPGIPVSDGRLPVVKQELGEVDGVPALITDLKTRDEGDGERLLFYTAVQHIEGELPRVRFQMREISRFDMTASDGHYVLKGDEFADDMKGWALVQVIGDRCSPQGIVTRCRYYEPYTTEEALEKAFDSYSKPTEIDI